MYDIDQGKAEVNENNMRKMATEITKIISALLDPNCDDEEPSIPQSVREIDEKMFDGLEEKIRALEAEEARRKRVKDKQKLYNDVGTEDDPNSPVKCPKVTSLVLDRNEKKEPLVQVVPR